MRLQKLISSCGLTCIIFLSACNSNDKEADKPETTKTETKTPKIKEETISYKIDTLNMSSYVFYDENIDGNLR